jgi:DNA-directed RNA polymerase subunit RPC12/RpoP
MDKIECPDCGSTSVELTGEGQAKCIVNDNRWERWHVEEAMEIVEASCEECGYRLTGDRVSEFGV